MEGIGIEILHKLSVGELMNALEGSGYSFAFWKLPQTEERHFIIGLDPFVTEEPLGQNRSGFAINAFTDQHPIRSVLIPSDIRISKGEVHVDPRVSAEQLDQLFAYLAKNPSKNLNKNDSLSPSNDFESLVAAAVKEISKGNLDKVVLSRFSEMALPEEFAVDEYFEKLAVNYPGAFCNVTYTQETGLWIGATPELILEESPTHFKTVSLAGTKDLTGLEDLSEVPWTQKEIEEQAMVSRYIIDCFKKIRLREFHEYGPKTIRAGQIAHLKTEYFVDFAEVNYKGLGAQMLELLHPTSAVCGMPYQKALEYILKHEGFDRDLFAGFIGPVGFEGTSKLFVNLRCMRILDGIVRFYAGAGITEDSNPAKEMIETELKMRTLKSLL